MNKKVCEVCQAAESKYKCPKCHMATCSLGCSKAHKVAQSCSGERDKTTFVPMTEFNEQHLMSDFGFLEEVNRVTSNSVRNNEGKPPGQKLPQKFKFMTRNAAERGISLTFMEKGLTKHDENHTRYNTKLRVFLWTVGWTFHGTDIRMLEHSIAEGAILKEVLTKKLSSVSDPVSKLQSFVTQSDSLCILYQKPFTPANQPQYFKLDPQRTLKANLYKLSVIEYPVFHVILGEDLPLFTVIPAPFELEEVKEEDESSSEEEPPSKRFKQEEPEDRESSESESESEPEEGDNVENGQEKSPKEEESNADEDPVKATKNEVPE